MLVVVSMKFLIIFLIIFNVSDSVAFDGDVGDIEEQFWCQASQFDEALHLSRQASEMQLEKLKNLSLKINKKTFTEEFYFKKYELIKYYANDEVMFEFLKENFGRFSAEHYDYLKIVRDYVISSNNTGHLENSFRYLNMLKESDNEVFNIYHRLINFEISRDEQSLADLLEICNSKCEFDYYYLALLNYYYSVGDYKNLKDLSDNILRDLISNDFKPSGKAFPQYIFAYLSVNASIECEIDVFNYLSRNALEGIPSDARDYEIIQSILPSYDSRCKN